MNARPITLENYVVPIVEATTTPPIVQLSKLFGTAFFIEKSGLFLAARHVLEKVYANPKKGTEIGLNVKHPTSGKNAYSPIVAHEFAPMPLDIAIGKSKYPAQSWFNTKEPDSYIWLDVATLGYPETALNVTDENFNIHLRALKGYVQRKIKANELPSHRPHPECFELSFAVPNGMSGTPLFSPKNGQELIGVCVGSVDSEITVFSQTGIEDGAIHYKEKVTRIEQYGIAHSIFPLMNWRPKLLNGKAISDVFAT